MTFNFFQRLQKFSDQGIGLDRSAVRLEKFNPRWKRLFSDEAYFIFDEIRDESLRLYHCGSTSVHGLDSKPVIDILGSVQSLEGLDSQKHRLESIGYEYKGEYGIKGRRYCVLYNPEKTKAFVHLHLFQRDDPEIEKHLSFRDHLRRSPKDLEKYLNHKRYLIEEAKIDRGEYSNAKSGVIAEIQKNAVGPERPQKILAILAAADGHKNTLAFLRENYQKSEIEIIEIKDSDLKPYSYLDMPQDKFVTLIQKALGADLLVLATPIYWYAMSGPMKDFVDRFSDLLSGDQKELGEALCGKRIKVLSTGSDPNLPVGFEVPFSATAIYFGMDYMGADYKSIKGTVSK